MDKIKNTNYSLRFDSPGPNTKTRHISELDIKQNDESEKKENAAIKNQLTSLTSKVSITKSSKTNNNNNELTSNSNIRSPINDSGKKNINLNSFNKICKENKVTTERSLNSNMIESPLKSQKSYNSKTIESPVKSLKSLNSISIKSPDKSFQGIAMKSFDHKKKILSPNGNQNTDNTETLGKKNSGSINQSEKSILSFNKFHRSNK